MTNNQNADSNKQVVLFDKKKKKKGKKPSKLPKNQVAPSNYHGKPAAFTSKRNAKKTYAKSIPRYVLAQVDPFSDRAFGCKIPDSNTADSCTAFSRNDYNVITGATGGAGAVFRAGMQFGATATPVSQTSWTWPATFGGGVYAGNLATITSSFAAIRTVSYGIQLSTRLSYTQAAGIVHVAILPEMLNLTTWDLPTTTSVLGYAPFHLKIPMSELVENGYTVTSKFTDATAHRYMDPGANDISSGVSYPAFMPSSGWNVIMVWVEGAPASSTVLDIEYIAHYECLTPAGAGSGVITATPATPHSPAVMAAVNYLNDNASPANVTNLDGSLGDVNWTAIWDAGLAIANGVGRVAEMALDFVPLLL